MLGCFQSHMAAGCGESVKCSTAPRYPSIELVAALWDQHWCVAAFCGGQGGRVLWGLLHPMVPCQ